MPVWCPKCHAMLPEGLEECPACGASLGKGESSKLFTRKDFFTFTLYIMAIALVPLILALGLGIVCSLFAR